MNYYIEVDDELVNAIDGFRNELLRPLFVFTSGLAKAHNGALRDTNPGLVKGGLTAAKKAAIEIDAIIKDYYERRYT